MRSIFDTRDNYHATIFDDSKSERELVLKIGLKEEEMRRVLRIARNLPEDKSEEEEKDRYSIDVFLGKKAGAKIGLKIVKDKVYFTEKNETKKLKDRETLIRDEIFMKGRNVYWQKIEEVKRKIFKHENDILSKRNKINFKSTEEHNQNIDETMTMYDRQILIKAAAEDEVWAEAERKIDEIKAKEKYWGDIRISRYHDVDRESLFIKLKGSDARKIVRIMKTLPTNLSAVMYEKNDMTKWTIEINLAEYGFIKIIEDQLHVQREGMFEFLIDEDEKVRDVVLSKTNHYHYDDMKIIYNILHPHRNTQWKKKELIIRETVEEKANTWEYIRREKLKKERKEERERRKKEKEQL
jgi:hypothetical protein